MIERPDVQYCPKHCAFLRQDVWAICMKQADGGWKIVNCLDKDDVCFSHPCAFTTDGGEWPFANQQVPLCQDQPQMP